MRTRSHDDISAMLSGSLDPSSDSNRHLHGLCLLHPAHVPSHPEFIQLVNMPWTSRCEGAFLEIGDFFNLGDPGAE
ncbi:hypothetical protein EYZ11_000025 [Aspergillus tanneri]|uniref:Uncharacterized protein n=1 Tax=Aspergillus tanneri TaxID=1220188 RepID=A0A4V3UQV6_9EURO|nr:uncharacterized protein ATNIH1004_000671 [Aspergillus tanneri]KAA8651775.1 hypothetical protein ATNIH1004_000671 [Aspergillus tanneri]THD00461.1 hypothetical protein EYZ11_000025 [Aspergillus tanneri]